MNRSIAVAMCLSLRLDSLSSLSLQSSTADGVCETGGGKRWNVGPAESRLRTVYIASLDSIGAREGSRKSATRWWWL